MRWDHPLWIQILATVPFVVGGPFAKRIVLTLIVAALGRVTVHQ
jgi:hypothetical protein